MPLCTIISPLTRCALQSWFWTAATWRRVKTFPSVVMATRRCGSVAAVHCRNTHAEGYIMEQSASWENDRFSASQEIPRILWNPNVHYRIHKCPPPLPILRHINAVPHTTLWRSILILSSHLRLGLPSGLFPSGFPTNTLYTPLLSPKRATRPAHLIILDFITQTILGQQYRSLSSSLCSFLHSPVTSSLLGPNTLLKLYSQTPSAYFPPSMYKTIDWIRVFIVLSCTKLS